jgi:hypothetical protein
MTTSRVPAYLVSGSGVVTIHMNGHVYTAAPDHSNYKNIVDALKAKRWKKLPDLFNVGKAIEKRSRKVLKVKDGQIFYGERPLFTTSLLTVSWTSWRKVSTSSRCSTSCVT